MNFSYSSTRFALLAKENNQLTFTCTRMLSHCVVELNKYHRTHYQTANATTSTRKKQYKSVITGQSFCLLKKQGMLEKLLSFSF